MRLHTTVLLSAVTALPLVACSAYDPDLGANPFLCGTTDPMCPSGYTCQPNAETPPKMICVVEGGTIVDAKPSGFQCADDSQIEGPGKNDTRETAYQTPVASQRKDIPYVGLAICPEGDLDVYAINTTTANQNIEFVVTWESGMPLSASLLNGGFTSINNATSNGPNSIKAYASALPQGTYYAKVFAGPTTRNNYNLNITVTP